MSRKNIISVVIPLYNEGDLLPELIGRLATVIEQENDFSWDVIFVNDCSNDGSAMELTRLSGECPWLRVLHLSRNFGHEVAITAGIDYAEGDAVVVMDGDLQDPPELIPKLLDRWLSGYDVVFAKFRQASEKKSLHLKVSKLFYNFLNANTSPAIPPDSGDFKLMSRKVVDAFSQLRERNRCLGGLISWLGFTQTSVFYEREPRLKGRSRYSLLHQVSYGVDTFLSFSKAPLQWIAAIGFLALVVGLVGTLMTLPLLLFFEGELAGWELLFFSIILFSGVQMLSISLVGQYVGRIFDEVQGRPLYVIGKIDNHFSRRPMMPLPQTNSHLTQALSEPFSNRSISSEETVSFTVN